LFVFIPRFQLQKRASANFVESLSRPAATKVSLTGSMAAAGDWW